MLKMAPAVAEPTLLGLSDGELDPQRHRTSFLTNKVGGRPDWIPALTRPRPCCRRCGAPSLLVVQVYCPLDTSPYHRNLHLFACPVADCGGGADAWTVLRSQCLEAEAAQASGPPGPPVPVQAAPLTATDWCAAADDWGEEEDGWGEGDERKNSEGQAEEPTAVTEARDERRDGERDVDQQLQNLHLEEEEDVPELRSFFITVVDEADLGCEEDVDGGLSHAHQLLQEYERREGMAVEEMQGGGAAASGGEEKYEKMKARHGDAVFSRFMKEIAVCPQQILRYRRGGEPLFISELPAHLAGAVTPCSSCGGPRTLELQLMPALVSLLRRRTDDGGGGGGDGGEQDVGLEFGTVLVYTCTKSCWTAGSTSAVEEVCVVQADPDQQLFR